MEELKIGLIGCGGIATAHVNGYKELFLRGIRVFLIKAVCDVIEDKAREKASMIEAFQGIKPKIYTNYEDMVKFEDLDAVDICTEHRSHHVIANFCLSSGLDVIIEKPLAITMRAARTILDTAKKYKRVLAVAENYRRSPINRTIKWCIDQGLIGSPRIVLWHSAHWTSLPLGWRGDKLVAGGSWVFDGGVHLADLDRYHLGREADEVYGVVRLFEPLRGGQRLTVDDTAMAIMKYGDIIVQWLWTIAAPAKSINARIVYGSKGYIDDHVLRIQESPDKIIEMNLHHVFRRMMNSLDVEKMEEMFPRGITDTFATELYDFYLATTKGKKPEVDGEEAYKDMAIPLAIYESSILGRPVKVKDVEELRIEEYQKEINDSLSL